MWPKKLVFSPNSRHRKVWSEATLCESVLTSNLGVQYWKKPQQLNSVTTKVKSHGLYELKSGMFAKSTQVTWTPLLGLHSLE